MWSPWQNNEDEQQAERQCSFCGKRRDQVGRLTFGPAQMAICNECVDLYREHLEKITKPLTMEKLTRTCPTCGTRAPASHHYCYNCGMKFTQEA